ncbi:MAG TPA: thioredoxin-disulfide reductase [Thermoanaerobaculia bacterium]|jgi:thioredoxin reductase (NADPH)|nr:thioredoxin-disulfide reductase [Thermoanaerobaculia bacterium]
MLDAQGERHHRLVILGSGPAGLTAALYAARANLAPLVLEGSQPGGQLTITTDVENYPGFPRGIMGPELVDLMREQARRFGAKSRFETVSRVDLSRRPFTIESDVATYTADALIVATGASAKQLGIASETHLLGYGVSACATCDGFFFRGKDVVVVGGGDTAVEEALFLTKFASKVTLVHRRDELRASKIMQERALKHEKIGFLWNSVITEVLGTREGGVTGVRLGDTRSGAESVHDTQGVFIAIGHQPNTAVFQGQLAMNAVGYLEVEEPTSRTSVEGVFAAGDVMDPHYRQAVTAAGTGCRAAIDAERWLETQGEHTPAATIQTQPPARATAAAAAAAAEGAA